jgi:3-isopropylmalate/(R)-2-methylmalate dehydratase small subunit
MTDRIEAIPALLDEDNIDTDVIFPARFLLILDRQGLGRYAFFERRNKGGFILDRAPWKGTGILVAGRNFGTGSSREQAVWALKDLGIRCVIAPSFGEIFFANCFRNGLLPITLLPDDMARVAAVARAGDSLTVDLSSQLVHLPSGPAMKFEISPHRKSALLAGLDEIGVILSEDMTAVADHEAKAARDTPWVQIPGERMAALRRAISGDTGQ